MKHWKSTFFISSLWILVETTKVYRDELGTMNYYVNLINNGVREAVNYVLPTDARSYKPEDESINDYGTYDFIIIGGGVSGTVLANRLSEITTWKVLLIEAGDYSDGGLNEINAYYNYHSKSKYNWGYTTVPQKNGCLGSPNRRCQVTSGKGVRGGSLINGLVYSRGPPEQYNELAKLTNDPSWNYQNLLQYFKKTERFHWTDPEVPINISYHGKYGLLDVELINSYPRFSKPFIKGNQELGYSVIDSNGPEMIGTTTIQRFVRFGRREDFGKAFIKPFLGRSNLKVTTQSYAIKIEINNATKIAESVLFTKNGKIYRAKASKEVISSAGAIASPRILMLSGVGPKDHLNSLGINIVQNLEVGSKFLDHVDFYIPISTDINFLEKSFPEKLADYLRGFGDLTVASYFSNVGYYQINRTHSGSPDFELFCFIPPNITTTMQRDIQTEKNLTITFAISFFRTKSSGTVRLKNNNPYEYPLIDNNLLSDENNKDIEGLYESLQHIFKLINTEPYKPYNPHYSGGPLSACADFQFESKEYWKCHLRQICSPGLHMAATCAMGTDPKKGAVVDSNSKVFGVKNLRVVDGGVFPKPIAGHTTIPCATVAEKISDVIKIEYNETVFQ